MSAKQFDYLGEFETAVMLTLIKLGSSAYGMKIRIELSERLEREVSIGAVYTTLERLETKGLVASKLGESTPERGGRAKKFFAITGLGQRTLDKALSIRDSLRAAAWLNLRSI